MCASGWQSDLVYYHDSFDFCSMDAVKGDRGPRNSYRRWSYTARPRDVLLFEPGHCHRAAGGPEASYKVLLVPESMLRQAKLEWTGRAGDVHFKIAATPAVYRHFEQLHGLLSSAAPEQLQVQSAFVSALDAVISGHSELGRLERIQKHAVKRARECIEDMLKTEPALRLSLEQLSRESGASGIYQLCRDFRGVTGVPPGEYIKLRKLALARQTLLTKSQRSIQHIAWDYGYTINAFSRAFHRQYGTSARGYRSAFKAVAP